MLSMKYCFKEKKSTELRTSELFDNIILAHTLSDASCSAFLLHYLVHSFEWLSSFGNFCGFLVLLQIVKAILLKVSAAFYNIGTHDYTWINDINNLFSTLKKAALLQYLTKGPKAH